MNGVGRGCAASSASHAAASIRAGSSSTRITSAIAVLTGESNPGFMAPTDRVRVALAQINATVGDFEGNTERILAVARAAHAAGACLLVAPELALTGYPPEDLLLRPAFMQASAQALARLAARTAAIAGLVVVVGHPHQFGTQGDERSRSWAVQHRFNAASVLRGGEVVATYCKRELPNYQVFDERRYFASGRDAGHGAVVFDAGGRRFGLLICEDAWFDEPAASAAAAGAQVLCVINASPFHLEKSDEREARMVERVRRTRSEERRVGKECRSRWS